MIQPIEHIERPEPVVFSYKKADVLLEAEKRSSYLGKMRGDKDHADFIDRMSLTEGESFLSEEMLADAIEHVYEYVQAFGRGIEYPYQVSTLDDESTGDESVGEVDDELYIIFTLLPREWWDRAAYGRVERYLKEALISYLLFLWYEYTNPEEAERFFAKYEDYAHNAQMGMNAEGMKLHHRFNSPIGTPAYTPVDNPIELNWK